MFRRRQSLGQTRKQLHEELVDPDERQQVLDWWTVTEDCFKTTRGDLSPLTDVIALDMATRAEEAQIGKAAGSAHYIGIRAGYSLRIQVDIFAYPMPLDVASLNAASLIAIAARRVDPETGFVALDEADDEPVSAAARLVGEYAVDRFEEVGSVSGAFWNAEVSVATHSLQKNLQKSAALRRGRTFDLATVDGLLRYGFVLRALDEALGIETPADEP